MALYKVICVATLLTLLIQGFHCLSEKYQFGDIISFKRGGVYKHYAIYVGNEPINGVTRTADQDIFHFSSTEKGIWRNNCIFGELAKDKIKPNVENYLDGVKNGNGVIHRGTDQQIKDRIEVMMDPDMCKKYSLGFNNCEHLATAVRYGYRVTKQKGTLAGFLFWSKKPEEYIELDKVVQEMVNQRHSDCLRSSDQSYQPVLFCSVVLPFLQVAAYYL